MVMEKEVHLNPFRTQKLSPLSPMVLHTRVWESRSPPIFYFALQDNVLRGFFLPWSSFDFLIKARGRYYNYLRASAPLRFNYTEVLSQWYLWFRCMTLQIWYQIAKTAKLREFFNLPKTRSPFSVISVFSVVKRYLSNMVSKREGHEVRKDARSF